MTCWKRKAGDKVSKSTSEAFEDDVDDSEDHAITSGDVDWLSLAPQKRCMMLEDAASKSNRLKEEGSKLTDTERYWEALRKWDTALQLTPDDYTIMEMKAQAYMMLNELYPALNAAEKTVEMNPLWWIGHQTLGRARLGLGEVRMALKCFSRAIHLNPAIEDLWNEDLLWASDLLKRKSAMEQQLTSDLEKEHAAAIEISEIPDYDDNSSESMQTCCEKRQPSHSCSGSNMTITEHSHHSVVAGQKNHQDFASSSSSTITKPSRTLRNLKHLPDNYIFMRDKP